MTSERKEPISTGVFVSQRIFRRDVRPRFLRGVRPTQLWNGDLHDGGGESG
jgi:hypothetical protein